MNTIKIFLGTDGSVFNWHQDTNIYQGAYQNTLLNIYVPLSILSAHRSGETIAVKSAMSYTDRAGKQKISESRYFSYVKDLTYNGVGYALYQRLMPKEYTLYAGNCNMIINVVTMAGELITSILTTQVCTLFILMSAYSDKEQTLTPTELETLEGEVNDLSSEVQKKQDSEPVDSNGNPALETASNTVTNAINEINTDYKLLEQRVETIENNYSAGEDYIGAIKSPTTPSPEYLTAYVLSSTGAQVKKGDVVYWYQTNTDDDIIKTVKFLYTKNNWLPDELPPVQKASNVNFGVVRGSQSDDSNDVRAYYNAGFLNDITIKDKGASTYHSIKNTSDDVSGIKDGAVVAKKAEQDQYGYNIFNTYASKQYVTDNTLPMLFNKMLYLVLGNDDTFSANFGMVATDIWASKVSDTSRTFDISSVGEIRLANAKYTLSDNEKFQVYADNNFKCNFKFSKALGGQYILRTYVKPTSNEVESLVGVDSIYVSDGASMVEFEGAFNRINEITKSWTIYPNGEIITVLSYVSESSISRTMTLYANSLSLTTGQLQIASIKLASGIVGESIFLDNWAVTQNTGAIVYELAEPNLNLKDGVSAIFKMPIPSGALDTDSVAIKLNASGDIINIYAPNKSTALNTLGDFAYYKDASTDGLYFTAFNDNGNWRVQGDNLSIIDEKASISYVDEKVSTLNTAIDEKQDKISRTDNLIPYPYYNTTKTSYGLTFTDNGDGTITVNGTATNNCTFYLSQNINKAINGSITLSGCPYGGSSSTYWFEVQIANTDGSNSYFGDYGTGNSSVSNGILRATYIIIKSGTTVNNLTFKPCLNIGTAPTRAYYANNTDIYPINKIVSSLNKTVSGKTTLYLHAVQGSITIDGVVCSFDGFRLVTNTSTPLTTSTFADSMYTSVNVLGAFSNSTENVSYIILNRGYRRIYAYKKDTSQMYEFYLPYSPLAVTITNDTVTRL